MSTYLKRMRISFIRRSAARRLVKVIGAQCIRPSHILRNFVLMPRSLYHLLKMPQQHRRDFLGKLYEAKMVRRVWVPRRQRDCAATFKSPHNNTQPLPMLPKSLQSNRSCDYHRMIEPLTCNPQSGLKIPRFEIWHSSSTCAAVQACSMLPPTSDALG
jgi:hypothetical protein